MNTLSADLQGKNQILFMKLLTGLDALREFALQFFQVNLLIFRTSASYFLHIYRV